MNMPKFQAGDLVANINTGIVGVVLSDADVHRIGGLSGYQYYSATYYAEITPSTTYALFEPDCIRINDDLRVGQQWGSLGPIEESIIEILQVLDSYTAKVRFLKSNKRAVGYLADLFTVKGGDIKYFLTKEPVKVMKEKAALTPHKHAEFIKAWADGYQIQYLNSSFTWQDTISPAWDNTTTYRVKPEEETRFIPINDPDLVEYQVKAEFSNGVLTNINVVSK